MIRSIAIADARGREGWSVIANQDDLPTALLYSPVVLHDARVGDRWIHVGTIGPRGKLTIAGQIARGRPERARVTRILEQARRDLVREERLRTSAASRWRENVAGRGSFVVELDDGRVYWFHSMRTEGDVHDQGAMNWAEAALESGHAQHADIFRTHVDGSRSEIYKPRILPSRDGHPDMIVGTYEHLPLGSLSRTPGDPFVRNYATPIVRRAYDAKAHAIQVVDNALFYHGVTPSNVNPGLFRGITPSDLADAWDVVHDAFEEARLPLQMEFAQANADYWRAREGVSSRRPAKPPPKRRKTKR